MKCTRSPTPGHTASHALTVTGNTGHKSMALYVGDGSYRKSPNIRFYADVVYTNTPPSGAFRGYGVPQGYWPVERHMEKISRALKLDPIEFRLKNAIHAGEYHPFSTAWNEGREPRPEIVNTVGLEQCVQQGKAAIDWDNKFGNVAWRDSSPKTSEAGSIQEAAVANSKKRRGIGVALVMQGTAIPYLDMGAASLKMNDDGSFNLLLGATDLGTGSDTVIAQMVAEVLGVPLDDITYILIRHGLHAVRQRRLCILYDLHIGRGGSEGGGTGCELNSDPGCNNAGYRRGFEHQTGK